MLSNSIELLTMISQMYLSYLYTYFDLNFLLAIRHNRDYNKVGKTSCSWLFNFQCVSRLRKFRSAPTPPLTQQQSTDNKQGLMKGGEGRRGGLSEQFRYRYWSIASNITNFRRTETSFKLLRCVLSYAHPESESSLEKWFTTVTTVKEFAVRLVIIVNVLEPVEACANPIPVEH